MLFENTIFCFMFFYIYIYIYIYIVFLLSNVFLWCVFSSKEHKTVLQKQISNMPESCVT